MPHVPSLDTRKVIIFAGALYDAPLWTNRQHIATRLAARGWRVLYVEPRLFLRSGHGQAQPRPENLSVVSQRNLLPGSRRWPVVARLNHALNRGRVLRAATGRGFGRTPVLLVYDTEAVEFLDDFPTSRVVYDCVDDHRAEAVAHGRSPQRVEEEERAIAARAAAIAVTTEPLRAHFAILHRNVVLAPNAADVAAFAAPRPEPDDLRRVPHPRIGTVGALDAYKLDVELLTAVVRQHPAWQFVMVGPVNYFGSRQWAVGRSGVTPDSRLPTLDSFPNVHFLGPKPREQVPAYVHAFDAAIIPYRESDYNRASFPLKFWEFLAAGKPIVASGLPSLQPYAHLVTLAAGPDAFARGIADALARGEEGRTARVGEAKRHDWSARVAAIGQLLLGTR